MYDVKIITYPDLSKQVRVYHMPVFEKGDKEKKEKELKIPECDPWNYEPVKEVHEFSDLERSIEVSRKRTVDKVHSYVRSNTWEYFVTFTFSKEKVDRFDFDECSKKLSQWLKDMKKRYCPNMCYLIIPERHKDGAYHFHGLFSNIDGMDIRDSGKTVIKKYKVGVRTRYRRTNEVIYLLGRYKLGWTTATVVKDSLRAGRYILKYITKDLVTNVKNKKRYWVSRNLEVPEVETFLLDGFDRRILCKELEEDASYHKIISCDAYPQVVNLFELDN